MTKKAKIKIQSFYDRHSHLLSRPGQLKHCFAFTLFFHLSVSKETEKKLPSVEEAFEVRKDWNDGIICETR